jgi:uncharacterized protein YegL
MTTKQRNRVNGNRVDGNHGADIAVAMILDKSASMGVVREAVIDGYNGYLRELRGSDRANGSRTGFSLTVFDTTFEHVWVGKPIVDVPALDHAHYVPEGMTALYDAVAHTVHETDRRLSEDGNEAMKVLVVVLTDGEENSSREYDAARLARLVAKYEARGNWTFVYLGAGHETLEEARVEAERIGLKRDNAMRWRADNTSARASMDMLSRATLARKAASTRRTDAFFADAGQAEADYTPEDEPAEHSQARPLTRKPLRATLPRRR